MRKGRSALHLAARGAWGLALLVLLGACGSSPIPSSSETPSAVVPQGRARCPGSVPVVLGNLRGAAADTLEALQGAYESKPGFRAVVFDGTKAIVIVEAASLPQWLAELAPKGIAVAPSCVDPALLAAVLAAVPGLRPRDGAVSAGYDALDDSISVLGVDAGALLAAMDALGAGMGDRARAAVAAGTLRIDGTQFSVSR